MRVFGIVEIDVSTRFQFPFSRAYIRARSRMRLLSANAGGATTFPNECDKMKNDEEKKTTKIDTSITPLNVTSDGRIILRGGIMIDFMTITCQTPNGASVRPMIMFHTDTMDNTSKPVCATCGCVIPDNRPVFLMSNGDHLYPCADEQEWVWWTVQGRDVKTLQGEE